MAIETARAAFTGAEDYVDVPLAEQVSADYYVIAGIVTPDAVFPVVVIDYANSDETNVRVLTSGHFNGYVNLVIIPNL